MFCDFRGCAMERVLRLFCSKFQLIEQKGLEVVISDTATERLWFSKFFLVGKVLSRKTINPNVVMPKADMEVNSLQTIVFCLAANIEECSVVR